MNGQTGRHDKANGSFYNFSNLPKKIENSIYVQGGIIFFNNTPREFPFRFIIIINHTQELLFMFYVFF